MFDQLLSYVKTTDDLQRFEEELLTLKELIYRNPDNYIEVSKDKLRPFVWEIISSKSDEINEDSLNAIIGDLNNIEKIDVVIAFEPTYGFINRLYDNLQISFNKKIVINLSFDPTIIGGAIFAYRGIYKDYSIKDAFLRELDESREVILEALGRGKE